MDELSGPFGSLALVHADEHLVVVEKPAGVLSVPGRGADKQDCMSARVQAVYPDALVVHRLDMATSGLLLMARGAAMQRRLSGAFAGREVRKGYEAIVHGLLAPDAGTVALPLAADWPNRPKQKVDQDTGKPSVTHWRVLERDSNAQRTRVELEPVTGRSHQLRVHLHAIGHPIVGDALYAGARAPAGAPRLMLHATRLELAHPATGEPLAFTSIAPF